jgi:predicted alpha/beta hydrolase family esterase
MPRRPNRSVPVVILHGWQGSGPEHWQSLLAEQLRADGREVRYPKLPNPDEPTLPAWSAALRECLAGLPDDGTPTESGTGGAGFDVVAHSLGAVLWLHHAEGGAPGPRPARVALVAPPSPNTAVDELVSFFPLRMDVDAVRHAAGGTVLVGGDDDPYLPEGIGTAYGLPLKIATTVVPSGGHLNAESGYGDWPAMLAWCRRDNLAFY